MYQGDREMQPLQILLELRKQRTETEMEKTTKTTLKERTKR